jgi:hypothetical protein
VRGKETKLGEGYPKVRLSQDRMAIFWIFTFGIVTLLYGSIRDFYVREDYVREQFVAAIKYVHLTQNKQTLRIIIILSYEVL